MGFYLNKTVIKKLSSMLVYYLLDDWSSTQKMSCYDGLDTLPSEIVRNFALMKKLDQQSENYANELKKKSRKMQKSHGWP